MADVKAYVPSYMVSVFERAGVDSVPYFILGGIYAVPGAVEPEVLADAMERTVAERAKREDAEMAQA